MSNGFIILVFVYRFWNIIGEKELYAVWMPNIEFSHIIVDRGMFHDHMPDSVQEAVEHLYQQLFDSKSTDHELNKGTKSNYNKNEPQYDHSKHNGLGVGVLGSDPDGTIKAETSEGTVKAPEVNVHTIEVILHQEHNSRADQEESTQV